LRRILQILSFFFPEPLNVWLHRLSGSKLGRNISIHAGVLILASEVEIKDGACIKFGTMIKVRSFKLGKKSSIGFWTFIKGVSDFIVEDACVIGARSMINCDRPVKFNYYSGNGPGCYIYTHGSFLPVTEGYRSTFSPVEIKEKVWIQMNCKIGPGVTIGEGSIILPGSVILESIEPNKMVMGDPGKLLKLPLLKKPIKMELMGEFAREILNEYCKWSNEYKDRACRLKNGFLYVTHKGRDFKITVDGPGDITVLTQKGAETNGMYFNLADLRTDNNKNFIKLNFEEFLRLYYGLIFL
jgi:acetyltransferase-like isoleucine patch superfamily enzyme